MRIVICLDYSSFTQKILSVTQSIIITMDDTEVYVIHIIDQMLFSATTGYELQLNDDLQEESKNLKEMAVKYLGDKIQYIEDYGSPRVKIDEILGQIDYDLLVIGTHARRNLGERLMGGIAEHLLRNARKPLLIIP